MKSYIVLDSRLCRPLVDPESAAYQFAVHNLLHEAAHVHDHAAQYQCFPGFYGSQIPSLCERTLIEFALTAWDEYIASRLSAPWGTPDYVSSFEDSLVQMIETARQRGNAAILEHNEHGDVGRTGTVLASIYGSLLTRASYVLGHVEGLETDLASEAPRWSQLVEQTLWLAPFWAEYRSILASMYATYGQWTGLDVLNPLKELLQRYLLSCGMLLQARPEGGCSMYFKRMWKGTRVRLSDVRTGWGSSCAVPKALFETALDTSPFVRLYSALCSGNRQPAFVTLPSPVRGAASASPRRSRQCPRPGSLRNVLYAMKRISTCLRTFIEANCP